MNLVGADSKTSTSQSVKIRFWPGIQIPIYLPEREQRMLCYPVKVPGHDGFSNKSGLLPILI